MTHTKWIVRLAVLVAFTAACSSTKETADDKVTVQGTVSEELYASDVQAVALGNDGRTFWAPIDVDGDFKLSLPTGQNYRVVLVRPASDGTSAIVAELAVTGGQGDATWLKGDHAATVRLGLIRAAQGPATPGAPAAEGSSLLKTASLTISRGGRGGRGGDDGLEDEAEGGRGGRGGHDEANEDDQDEWNDDQAHADDMGCHEGKPMNDDNGGVCTLTTTKTVHCSHGGEFAVYTTVTKEIVPCGANVQPPPPPAADDTPAPAPDATDSTDPPAADPPADDCASPGLCG